MAEAIFLSAGVPDPKRGAEFAATADTVAITAAVAALVHVTLGRRLLVWAGQPSITPMVWVVAKDIGVEYGQWVRLYQSRHFQDEFPEDNERFQNVRYTENVDNDREKSLLVMRERMFSEHEFSAAVFIGGMGGIIQEYELFHRIHPNASVVPIISTGGAALLVAERLPTLREDLSTDLDYVALFHRHLGISVREERFPRPQDQPAAVDQRYWRARDVPVLDQSREVGFQVDALSGTKGKELGTPVTPKTRELLERKVKDVHELSPRSRNSLQEEQIETLADLVSNTEDEMLASEGFGKKSLKEIQDFLAEHNLRFGMRILKGDGGELFFEETDEAPEAAEAEDAGRAPVDRDFPP